jgi:N,N'-diacetyllegionaminate synthase
MNKGKVAIIAEIGSVHDGSFGNAMKAIEAAAGCGATIVKFQTHISEAETLRNAPMPPYFKGEPRYEYFKRTGFSLIQWKQLFAHCKECGVDFLSSPFSLEAVDLLEEVGAPAYKIPSGEVTNLPLMEKIAATGKTVYLSSGMSNWEEIDAAVAALKKGGPLIVMQCSSAYPCPADKVGLNIMVEMASRYRVPVGYSDHTLGIAASVAAVALGAVVVEKHFTFSKLMYGSDARNSMEPEDFKKYCAEVREAADIMANPVNKDDLAPYKDMKGIFEKSIVAARALKAGTVLVREDLAFKKPGDGISAARWKEVIGMQIEGDVPADHKFALKDLKPTRTTIPVNGKNDHKL